MEPVSKATTNTCYRCGRTGLFMWQCLFKNLKCYNCGKIVHAKKACQAGKSQEVDLRTETGRQ